MDSSATPLPPSSPRKRPREAQLLVHERFLSRGLQGCRDIAVWLPPGYGVSRRRHPVIYFQDGQNIFDPLTAFLGNAWLAGHKATALIQRGAIVPPIMVGIYNTGFNRVNEYTPTRAEFDGWDGEKCTSTGDAKRYARIVVQELKPFIDARYLTQPGPQTTSVVGSSMGGLVSLYFGLWHPRVFGAVAALSPSVWWDNRVTLRDFARSRRKPAFRLWLDIGTAEPGWEVMPLFRDTLLNRGWVLGKNLAYRKIPGGEHTEAAWAARLGPVLRFLVGRPTAKPKPKKGPPKRRASKQA
ncbi:MAG: alpha/beta hydrolase-fold protein [Candidatus Didemnitutus sp.]|nr:alpha/beta hydrolase-fold protein [Candidatus Didemnitutus sp.]